MSNFYLCDMCENSLESVVSGFKIDNDGVICFGHVRPKAVVMDNDNRPLYEICPIQMFTERKEK